MSEHIGVKGKVDFYHLPYREKDGFTACRFCLKKGHFSNELLIEFHEGFGSDWMRVVCGKCNKTIWVSSFRIDPRYDLFVDKKERNRIKKLKEEDLSYELEGVRRQVKDDKKCEICKKPTNHYDSVCSGSMGIYKNGKVYYLCSNKCYKKMDKLHNKLLKKYKEKNK